MRIPGWVGLGLLSFAIGVSGANGQGSLQSPRPNGWVVDSAQLLSPGDEATLQQLGDAVHRRDGAELVVVTVESIGGAEPRSYATALFNRWRLGDRRRNNGLLIFVATRDRAAEIILGDGIDSDAAVARSDGIMQRQMVPRFRQGDYAGGIVAGAKACAAGFFGVSIDAVADPASADPAAPARTSTAVEVENPAPVRAPPAARPSPTAARRQTSNTGAYVTLTIAAVGALGLVGGIGGAVYLRRRPRRCPNCSMTMTKLDEAADDAHLAEAEKAEERLGSVNYDVWLCEGCQHVVKTRHGRWFSRYARCRNCSAVTAAKAQRTLQSATTFSTGLLEIREHCRHCGHEHVFTRVIPRVQRRTTGSGSSFGSRSGGGGRSSGRGSSGRW